MRLLPVPLRLVAVLSVLLATGSAWSAHAAPSTSTALAIRTLSNRADLISGGDALVQVDLPSGARTAHVTVDGRDVSTAFAVRPNGRYQGLLTGLRDGVNKVVARAAGQAAQLLVTNHPNGGPVFSGPQIQPWTCQATA